MDRSPIVCTVGTCPLDDAFIHYQPTVVGNSIYLAFFAAILIAQTVQAITYRTPGFYVGVFCGLVLEIVGYAGRLLLHNDPFNINYFIIYLVCLTIAPAFVMASIYFSTGRVVHAYGSQHSRIRPRSYALICIATDLVSLILQAVGGGIAAVAVKTDGDNIPMGTHILVAGLAFQLFSTLLFAALVTDFSWRYYKSRSSRDSSSVTARNRVRWKGLLVALAVATVCIFVRSAFRVDELQAGFGSDVANNQTLFMVFEGPFVIAACLSLTFFHPGFGFHGMQVSEK